jgi:hypothetical protein
MIVPKAIAITLLLALMPRASDAARISHLSCDHLLTNFVDAAESAVVWKATLNGNYFTVWVDLALSDDVLKQDPKATLEGAGMGYQMDDSPIVGMHLFVRATNVPVSFSFPHLRSGAHRLRVGLFDGNSLDQVTTWCFITPGHATWTSPH